MNPRQLLEAFLPPPKVLELWPEVNFLARAKTSSVRLEGTKFWIYRWGLGPPVLLVHD